MKTPATITDEQEEALTIVRNLLSLTIDPNRITCGSAKTYFPIMLDGNPWKTICRFYFGENSAIGVLSTRRVETKTRISKTDDIKVFASDMKVLVEKYG